MEFPAYLKTALYFPFLVNLTLNAAIPFELVLALYVFLFTFNLIMLFLMSLFLLLLNVTVTFLVFDLALNFLEDAVSFGVAFLTVTLAVFAEDL